MDAILSTDNIGALGAALAATEKQSRVIAVNSLVMSGFPIRRLVANTI